MSMKMEAHSRITFFPTQLVTRWAGDVYRRTMAAVLLLELWLEPKWIGSEERCEELVFIASALRGHASRVRRAMNFVEFFGRLEVLCRVLELSQNHLCKCLADKTPSEKHVADDFLIVELQLGLLRDDLEVILRALVGERRAA